MAHSRKVLICLTAIIPLLLLTSCDEDEKEKMVCVPLRRLTAQTDHEVIAEMDAIQKAGLKQGMMDGYITDYMNQRDQIRAACDEKEAGTEDDDPFGWTKDI